MISPTGAQVLAGVVYGYLLAWLAYAHPRFPPTRRPLRGSPSDAQGSSALEVLWLASLATIVLYPLGVLLFPVAMLSSPWTVRFPSDELVQFEGVILWLSGGALVGWAFRSLGRFATVRIQLSEDHRVIRAGPYSRIRHPMYTANVLLSLGIALTFLSLILWLPVALVILLADRRAREEERMFSASPRLGAGYGEYMARTGRFLPRCAGRRT